MFDISHDDLMLFLDKNLKYKYRFLPQMNESIKAKVQFVEARLGFLEANADFLKKQQKKIQDEIESLKDTIMVMKVEAEIGYPEDEWHIQKTENNKKDNKLLKTQHEKG